MPKLLRFSAAARDYEVLMHTAARADSLRRSLSPQWTHAAQYLDFVCCPFPVEQIALFRSGAEYMIDVIAKQEMTKIPPNYKPGPKHRL